MAKMTGVNQLRSVLRKLPRDMQDAATKELKSSTERMHRHAIGLLNTAGALAPLWHGEAGMQTITGAARAAYRRSFSQKSMTVRVGLLSSSALKQGYYLRFFNDGTIHQPARPFHDIAAETERPLFEAAQKRALAQVFARLG